MESDTAAVETATTERMVEIPEHCPTWCDVDHVKFWAESEGTADAFEVATHIGYVADEMFVPELRNAQDQRIERAGGFSWDVTIQQDPHPTLLTRGYNGPPLVMLDAKQEFRQPGRLMPEREDKTRLQLTTGEARVIAAALIEAANRVDLERFTYKK